VADLFSSPPYARSEVARSFCVTGWFSLLVILFAFIRVIRGLTILLFASFRVHSRAKNSPTGSRLLEREPRQELKARAPLWEFARRKNGDVNDFYGLR